MKLNPEKLSKFIDIAKSVALLSKDRSRKVGSLILGPDWGIRSTGYNGFPRKVNDDVDHRHTRPIKYMYSEHAERNAIYAAAKVGTSTEGCMIFVTTLFVCHECARAVIQAGISTVISEYSPNFEDPNFGDSFKVSVEMFEEAGIEIICMDDVLKSTLPPPKPVNFLYTKCTNFTFPENTKYLLVELYTHEKGGEWSKPMSRVEWPDFTFPPINLYSIMRQPAYEEKLSRIRSAARVGCSASTLVFLSKKKLELEYFYKIRS